MATKAFLWALLVAVAGMAGNVDALDNGLGLVPQMGWNSWNAYACGVNENLMMQAADAIVSTGLADLGYNFVNVDDCWAYRRAANGTIESDPTTFPSGMAALVDYVHSKGLKFGIYSDIGDFTCAGRPGSFNYNKEDADFYASIGVDYLKLDDCYIPSGYTQEELYPIMRDALNATGRPIFFSLCDQGQDDVTAWGPSVGNSWRTTHDVKDYWTSVLSNLDLNNAAWEVAAPGGWNDPDLLEVGNGGMTATEYISQMSLWSLVKAPLLISTDLTNMTAETLAILSNKEVIAVNQDPQTLQGHVVEASPGNVTQVYGGPVAMSTGAWAFILFNRDDNASHNITASFASFIDLPDVNATAFVVRDLWAHADLGSFTGSFTHQVASHGVFYGTATPAKA